jgi:hypothetical protein
VITSMAHRGRHSAERAALALAGAGRPAQARAGPRRLADAHPKAPQRTPSMAPGPRLRSAAGASPGGLVGDSWPAPQPRSPRRRQRDGIVSGPAHRNPHPLFPCLCKTKQAHCPQPARRENTTRPGAGGGMLDSISLALLPLQVARPGRARTCVWIIACSACEPAPWTAGPGFPA